MKNCWNRFFSKNELEMYWCFYLKVISSFLIFFVLICFNQIIRKTMSQKHEINMSRHEKCLKSGFGPQATSSMTNQTDQFRVITLGKLVRFWSLLSSMTPVIDLFSVQGCAANSHGVISLICWCWYTCTAHTYLYKYIFKEKD